MLYQFTKLKFTDKSEQTYKDAEVNYEDPVSNEVISGKVTITDLVNTNGISFNTIDTASENSLVMTDKVENKQQAEAKATAALYKANTRTKTLTGTLYGEPLMVSGVNWKLTGAGKVISGLYHNVKSTHDVSKSGGWVTDIDCKKVGVAVASEMTEKKPSVDAPVVVKQNTNRNGITFGTIE